MVLHQFLRDDVESIIRQALDEVERTQPPAAAPEGFAWKPFVQVLEDANTCKLSLKTTWAAVPRALTGA